MRLFGSHLLTARGAGEVGQGRPEKEVREEVGRLADEDAGRTPAARAAAGRVASAAHDVVVAGALQLDHLADVLGVVGEVGVHNQNEVVARVRETVHVGGAEPELAGTAQQLQVDGGEERLELGVHIGRAVGAAIVHEQNLILQRSEDVDEEVDNVREVVLLVVARQNDGQAPYDVPHGGLTDANEGTWLGVEMVRQCVGVGLRGGGRKAWAAAQGVGDGSSFYSEPKALTAAQRKKLKKKQQAFELEAKLAAERESAPNLKAAEDEDLRLQLAAVGKVVFKIHGDGNCLFRAVEHQLAQANERGAALRAHDHAQLRQLAVQYMRAHRAELEAFVEGVSSDVGGDSDAFEAHCNKIALDGEWGGELEVQVLAAALGCRIVVYRQGAPPTEYVSDEGSRRRGSRVGVRATLAESVIDAVERCGAAAQHDRAMSSHSARTVAESPRP
ncbi:OTU domain-containing protein 6B [Babesia caballi]|uniref:OTU domain-containing protein 6B n=1 Tax=Babesia caballi TaxID=5871 RepID=A0AAV4LU97_BABCB|nr:OTU domain-containing protein 6B [Babesia caballi]